MKKKDIEALESEIIRMHIAELEKQLSDVENKRAELEYLKESLSQIKGQKGKEILFPLGSGILMRGKIVDDEKLIMNIGSNVFMEKSISEARKIIDSQISELLKLKVMIENELRKYLG